MTEHYKYRKTFHLPFSKGLKNDDRRLEDIACFNGKSIAITIKMDGENTSMYRDGIHARSLYTMSHPSQHYIKNYWGTMKYKIPENYRVCGENMYARHSIAYNNLESFFYVFNVWDENNMCLDFSETLDFCAERGFTHVPIISTANISENGSEGMWRIIEDCYTQTVANGDEGIVVRNVESFHYDDFQTNIAKAVRRNHVQTDVHWTKTWVPNKLKI